MRLQMFYKIDVLEIFLKFKAKRLYQILFTLAQMFSREFLKLFRSTFFTEHL